MTIFTIHVPPGSGSSGRQPEDLKFVPDKFRYTAFFFGPAWLLANRLWLALTGWFAVIIAIAVIAKLFALQPQSVFGLYLILALLLGLEGSTLQRYGLARRQYRLIDIASGRSLGAAELSHFSRWRQGNTGLDTHAPVARPSGRIMDNSQSAGLSPVETSS